MGVLAIALKVLCSLLFGSFACGSAYEIAKPSLSRRIVIGEAVSLPFLAGLAITPWIGWFWFALCFFAHLPAILFLPGKIERRYQRYCKQRGWTPVYKCNFATEPAGWIPPMEAKDKLARYLGRLVRD